MDMQHSIHEHALKFRMLSDKETDNKCDVCSYQICGPAFICEEEGCSYRRHKSCSVLPIVIEKHPFHPVHSLSLQLPNSLEEDEESYFICNGCGNLSSGYRFVCRWCHFFLDIKCARAGCGDVETTILHFGHKHHLNRYILRNNSECKCLACKEVISGPTYECLDCQFIVHEACLDDMPQEILHPIHAHHLLRKTMSDDTIETCDACFEDIRGISFECADCKFYLHASCAKYEIRAIKHESHQHDLLYFGSRNICIYVTCQYCGESCSGSFFFCFKCQFYIHLECLPLPFSVRHIRHIHPLTLMASIVEDDFGVYYCDICETQRNPEHYVYYCKECEFVSHIDCVISETIPPEEILSYLVPRPKMESEADKKLAQNKPDDDNGEALGELDEIDKEMVGLKEQIQELFTKLKALNEKRSNIQ